VSHRNTQIDRRRFLQLGAAAASMGALGGILPQVASAEAPGPASGASAKDRKLLFVFCAYGGASIIDSFMPIADYDGGNPLAAAELNTYPDWLLEKQPGSNLRTVKLLGDYAYYGKPTKGLSEFTAHHGKDMAVIAHEVSSVNHTVGQQRSLNGAGFDRGRTIMESAVLRHGMSLPLPSCNMAFEGFVRHGLDPSVPAAARHELIMAPTLFAAGTHGSRGLSGVPGEKAIARARKLREQLEQRSVFGRTFERDARRAAYLRTRREISPGLESAGLLEKLLLLEPSAIDPKFGVKPDPLAVALRSSLPKLDEDRMEAQIALGFLMAYHGVSSSVSMGFNTEPVVMKDGTIIGAPISFDFSHNMHRVVQSLMWSRTATLVDSLITLLKTHDYLGDPALGKMWDRSLVYVATEFGRDKKRPFLSEGWGTGHDLNNGSLLISPLLKGNAVYGGVDPLTGLTHGFDPATGAPDKTRKMDERDVYGIVAQALGVEVPEGRSYPAVVRGV
jgi:hypothetical protein